MFRLLRSGLHVCVLMSDAMAQYYLSVNMTSLCVVCPCVHPINTDLELKVSMVLPFVTYWENLHGFPTICGAINLQPSGTPHSAKIKTYEEHLTLPIC